jgi:hypothetical protein
MGLNDTLQPHSKQPKNVIPWSHTLDDYFFRQSNVHEYNVSIESVATRLLEKVKNNGNRIFVGSYQITGNHESSELRYVSLAQRGDPVVHTGICLGDNVAFLTVSTSAIMLLQTPSSFRLWDMCELPIQNVDQAVRIIIDTVLRCWKSRVAYNCHFLENVEHWLCRLMKKNHAECDSMQDDYDFDSPDTWKRGVQCSQLVLLVLKRFIKHKVLLIEDQERCKEFMSVYSHTCCPGPLCRLINRTWNPEHFSVEYNRDVCFKTFDTTKTQLHDLTDDSQ